MSNKSIRASGRIVDFVITFFALLIGYVGLLQFGAIETTDLKGILIGAALLAASIIIVKDRILPKALQDKE